LIATTGRWIFAIYNLVYLFHFALLLLFLSLDRTMTMNEDQEWKPQAEGLQQIIQLLKESQSIDNTVQKNVQKVNIEQNLTFAKFSVLNFLFLF
jgi:hypothetical protein